MILGGRVDLSSFSPAARQVFAAALHEAQRLGTGYVGVDHLFLALLAAGGGDLRAAFAAAGLDPERLVRVVGGWLRAERAPAGGGPPLFTPRLERVQAAAHLLAARRGRSALVPAELAEALLDDSRAATTRILAAYRPERLPALRQDLARIAEAARDDESSPDDPLARFGTTPAPAAEENAVLGRDELLGEILARLARGELPIWVGEEGVGRRALVQGLAAALGRPGAPARLHGRRLVEVGPDSLHRGLLAGVAPSAQVESLLARAAADERVLLFLRDLDRLLAASDLGVAAQFRAALLRGEPMAVASTTPGGWAALLGQEPRLARRLAPLAAEEPPARIVLQVLQRVARAQESFHRTRILPEALRAAVVLSARFLPERRLPGKAIEVLEQACAWPILAGLAPRQSGPETAPATPRPVRAREVAEAVARASGVPIARVLAAPREVRAGLGEALRAALVAQAETVTAVEEALRPGLRLHRARAVLLLLGPPGVGKSELAVALAAHLYGSAQRVARFDLAEHRGDADLPELLGEARAHGLGREGALVACLRRAPWSLLYFDHVEAAAPRLLAALAEALAAGELHSAAGPRASLEHAVLAFASCEPEERVRAALPAALLARVDAAARFAPLGPAELRAVLARRLDATAAELWEQGASLRVDPEVLEHLLARGDDGGHGARPCLRAFHHLFLVPLRRESSRSEAPRPLLAVIRHGEIAFLRDEEPPPPSSPA